MMTDAATYMEEKEDTLSDIVERARARAVNDGSKFQLQVSTVNGSVHRGALRANGENVLALSNLGITLFIRWDQIVGLNIES